MTDFGATLLEAVRHHQAGNLEAAKDGYRQVLEISSSQADALHLLGVIAIQEADNDSAVDFIRQAIDAGVNLAEAHLNLGTALKRLSRFAEALEAFDAANRLKPDFPIIVCNRAHCLVNLRRYQEGLVELDRAVGIAGSIEGLDYDPAAFHSDRGHALQELGRHDEALVEFDTAISLNDELPEVWSNRGSALSELGQLSLAIENFDKAISINPRQVLAHYNKGAVLADLGRNRESIESHERALELVPGLPTAAFGAALGYLRDGDYARGWPLYESRFDLNEMQTASPYLRHPRRWNGTESLVGKRIVLWAEQGLGDTIQFCRYATLVAKQGARVLLFLPESLREICSGIEGVAGTTSIIVQDYDFDFHCPLMSLPTIFGTTLESIPFNEKPYLFTDQAKFERWQVRLGPRLKPRVGIVWSGGSASKIKGRSIPLSEFHVLLDRDLEFISLQKEVRASDRIALDVLSEIKHFGDEQKDFDDAAALIENMDVVVSVDTSLAHLAGALGKEVHVLLPFAADWRWLQDTDRSPWYASARLYRRAADGSWDSVLRQVRQQLVARFVPVMRMKKRW